MRTRGLEHVPPLQHAHQRHVPREDPEREGGEVAVRDRADRAKAREEREERALVAGAVIDAARVAETLAEVRRELDERAGGGVLREDDADEVCRSRDKRARGGQGNALEGWGEGEWGMGRAPARDATGGGGF